MFQVDVNVIEDKKVMLTKGLWSDRQRKYLRLSNKYTHHLTIDPGLHGKCELVAGRLN